MCRLTIDEADLEPGALASLAASLQLLPAPEPSFGDDDLLPPLVGRSMSDAALTAALIAEQLGDAEVLHTTGARSQFTTPVRRPSAMTLFSTHPSMSAAQMSPLVRRHQVPC